MLSQLIPLILIHTVWGNTYSQYSPRIYNGTLAAKGQFPWQAALFIPKNNGMDFCGGALISERWVLTAAHCLRGAYFRIRVLLGTTKSTGNDPDQLELHSREWFLGDEFDPWSFEGDLGLIKLPEAVTFTDNIKPIALVSESLHGTDIPVTVSGWGMITAGGTRVADLMYSDLFTDGDDGTPTIVTHPYSNSTAQNICPSDSGGALVANYSTTPVHIGIVSWYQRCEPGAQAGFTSTFHYNNWILERLQM